jgi:histidine triad (HIT) family protein
VTQSDCLFCKIVAKQIPAGIVYQDDQVTAFRDLDPQAPVHVLIVPNEHIDNTESIQPQHDASTAAVLRAARTIAQSEGVNESGYRLVVNTGRDAQNSVAHLHMHLLGGRQFTWPPG